MLNTKISDLSGSLYVCFMRELGDPIMGGMSAKELKEFKEENSNDIEKIKQLFAENTFKVRINSNSLVLHLYFESEARLKF